MLDEPARDRPMTLREMVDEHLDEHAEKSLSEAGDSLKEATETMIARVRGDPRMREEVFNVLLELACHERLRKVLQKRNKAIWHSHEQNKIAKVTGERLRSAARYASRLRLMNYTLMGGLRLGDANYEDLTRNYEFQQRQATRMAATAKWLRLISEKLKESPKNTPVRNALTEEDLIDLQAKALEKKESQT